MWPGHKHSSMTDTKHRSRLVRHGPAESEARVGSAASCCHSADHDQSRRAGESCSYRHPSPTLEAYTAPSSLTTLQPAAGRLQTACMAAPRVMHGLPGSASLDASSSGHAQYLLPRLQVSTGPALGQLLCQVYWAAHGDCEFVAPPRDHKGLGQHPPHAAVKEWHHDWVPASTRGELPACCGGAETVGLPAAPVAVRAVCVRDAVRTVRGTARLDWLSSHA